MARTAPLEITYADCAFLQQRIFLELLLQAISDLLDKQHAMIEVVQRDLERGLKNQNGS